MTSDTQPRTDQPESQRPQAGIPRLTVPTPSASVPMSPERFARLPGGVEICFQTFGEESNRPLLLVMGLAGPMTWWPEDLCRMLAAQGFFVVRYDNRDTGRSTRFDRHRITRGHLVRAFLGRRVFVPYTLGDMAEDGLGLLDHLGLEAAHLAGVSMGGMIAQTMAVDHPDRVLSLTSIMSTTGSRRVGYQDPTLLPHFLRRAARSRTAYVESSVDFWRRIWSPADHDPEEQFRERARVTWERGVSLTGVTRQTVAVLTQPDRTRALHGLTMPVTVLHGLADRMVHVSGGRATARAVPGAHLTLVPGLGHDIPHALLEVFLAAISRSADALR